MFNRRQFLSTSLGATLAGVLPGNLSVFSQASAEPSELIKPPALQKGQTIGLITPGSPLYESQRTILEAREKLKNLGFKTKLGQHILEKKGYLAGSIEARVDDIHTMFEDDEVKAVMTIRGGYGSGQLLPYLDYDLIRKHSKIILGYSDVTALLIGIRMMAGLVTFHGPVAVSTFTPYTRKYMLKTLGVAQPTGEIDDAPYEANLQTSNRVWSYRKGVGEGRLIGGNLTLMQATLGTPYEFDSRDAIIFIEEIGEEPYDVDRMLTHLKQAGKFEHCRGVCFDGMQKVRPSSHNPAFNSTLSVESIIARIFKDYDFPVCIGLSLGHIKDKPTLPLGVQSRLDGDTGRLWLLESAVRE